MPKNPQVKSINDTPKNNIAWIIDKFIGKQCLSINDYPETIAPYYQRSLTACYGTILHKCRQPEVERGLFALKKAPYNNIHRNL